MNVDELIKRLPSGYEQACRERKAIERARQIKRPADLIRLVLMYLCGGYSQIEMSVIASGFGIQLSDVGFLKKFAKCKEWLAWIVSSILPRPIIEYPIPKKLIGYILVALDASDVSEKGSSGRTFRLHYAIDILKMMSLSYKITGQKVGETLLNHELKKNWLIIADRIYGTLRGIEYCLSQGANFILRLKHNAFNMYRANGTQIDLLAQIADIAEGSAKGIEVYVKLANMSLVKLRVCIGRIPEEKRERAVRKHQRKAAKKQQTLSRDALDLSQYVVVITALPESVSAQEVISLYRLRWQVEIYFKRLKSIMDFGNVPLRREDSVMTWLTGKLLISLLIEQMIAEVSFPPCGSEDPEYLEGSQDDLQDAPRQHSASQRHLGALCHDIAEAAD
jgi:hypothetical protein